MESSAPGSVASPDWWGEEDQVEPEEPADVVESQGDEHVGVQRGAGTSQGGEGEKDHDGEQQTDQRYPERDQCHRVDRHVDVGGLKVQTGSVVGPAPAKFRSHLLTLNTTYVADLLVCLRVDQPPPALVTMLASEPSGVEAQV